jgi:hypothetical protein
VSYFIIADLVGDLCIRCPHFSVVRTRSTPFEKKLKSYSFALAD